MVNVQLHYASKMLNGYSDDPNETTQRAMIYFNQKYMQQQGKLLAFGNTFWSALQRNAHFDKEWINQWNAAIHPICSELNSLDKQGKLEMPYFSERNDAQQGLTSILASVIHMTNNRLGVPNSEEPYIAFLLLQIAEALREESHELPSAL